jgi:plasmid maintenance system antidote protein VapI
MTKKVKNSKARNANIGYGRLVALLRCIYGISQEDLAKGAGMSLVDIKYIEDEEAVITLDMMWALAKVFGTTPAKMLVLCERYSPKDIAECLLLLD